MLYAVKNGEKRKVKVAHWWPGRKFKGASPMPCFLIEEAKRMGSQHLTWLAVPVDKDHIACATAFANKNEEEWPVTKEHGEIQAALYLAKNLAQHGWEVMYGPHH